MAPSPPQPATQRSQPSQTLVHRLTYGLWQSFSHDDVPVHLALSAATHSAIPLKAHFLPGSQQEQGVILPLHGLRRLLFQAMYLLCKLLLNLGLLSNNLSSLTLLISPYPSMLLGPLTRAAVPPATHISHHANTLNVKLSHHAPLGLTQYGGATDQNSCQPHCPTKGMPHSGIYTHQQVHPFKNFSFAI